MNFLTNLLNLRKKINKIDKKIIKILSKRKKIIKLIAKIKIKNNYKIKDLKREQELLKFITLKSIKYKLNIKLIKKIFTLIIQESINIQKKILKKKKKKKNIPKLFFLGPIGSYSHIATIKYFKKNISKFQQIHCKNFLETIKNNENILSSYTILPIENLCSGYIKEILYLLKKTNLFIIDEIYIPIKHCLISIKNNKIKNIKYIYSHIQPIKQSSNYIIKYPKWKLYYTQSSSDAIKKIFHINNKYTAGIGNKKCSKIYKLSILNKNISNMKNNKTRFIILSNNTNKILKKQKCKLIIIFKINITNYKLIHILYLFKKQKYNITEINNYSYIYKNKHIFKTFFLEIKISTYSKKIIKIFKNIKKYTTYLKVLGLYPIKKTKI